MSNFDLMTSRYIHSTWEECISHIPDESIDLIYTDPPYGMQYVSGIPGDKRWNKSEKSDSKFDNPILNDGACDLDWPSMMEEFYRILKPDTYMVLHCNHQLFGRSLWPLVEDEECASRSKGKFVYKGTVAWNKKFAIGGDLRGAMKRDWEPIVYLAKGKPRLRKIKVLRPEFVQAIGKNGNPTTKKTGKMTLQDRSRISEIGDDWNFQLPKHEKVGFPTQKPIDLCKQWILLTTDPGQVLFDAFAGSGAILRAAMAVGRVCIATEADEEVYKRFHADFENKSDNFTQG